MSPNGLLLIVLHGSVAPWSWADPDTAYPTPEAIVEELSLDPDRWSGVFVGTPERDSRGPGGQVSGMAIAGCHSRR